MESGGVTLTSSLTYESGERIKGERGEWGVNRQWSQDILTITQPILHQINLMLMPESGIKSLTDSIGFRHQHSGFMNLEYVHLLNWAFTATERTICYTLEDYQKEDGVEVREEKISWENS
ncbi:hypothetical protein WN943_007669 [Citrus x changshan-huyou]